ncbi:MAG: hypothetical protein KKE65_10345, partial [Actinobacteria bacterium]|nr:hypothetical protein [Actinomycetota bacterium]
EYVIPPDMTALTPEKLKPGTAFGGAKVQGGQLAGTLVFWQRGATKLREYPDPEAKEEAVDDLSYHAEHYFGPVAGTAVECDFAALPYSMVYVVRSDGVLCALAYSKQLGMRAWQTLGVGGGGLVKSIAVAEGTSRDAVWAIVLRGTHYCVEIFDGIEDMTAIPLGAWVDVATAGATVTGLGRFDGKTATIWNVTEAAVYTAAVAAGSLTTPTACVGDHLVVGAGLTCTMKSLRLLTVGQEGPALGTLRQVSKVYAEVLESYPFKLGRVATASQLEATPFPDGYTATFTGVVECPFRGESNRDTWIIAIQDLPYRSQILALIPEVDT